MPTSYISGGTTVIGPSSGNSGGSTATLPASLTAVATDASGNPVQATAIPYSALSGAPTIPTNTNQLTNGANFITAAQAPVQSVAGRTGAVVIAAGDVSGLAASATTDTTNATNIASGTLALARIPTIPYSQTSGFGTAATQSTGTSGATIPVLNVANTWGATQTFVNGLTVGAGSTGTSSWINMPTGGPSGIGTGGAGVNPWIAYVSGANQFFTGAAAGDIIYRNTGGSMLFGNTTGNPTLKINGNVSYFGTGQQANFSTAGVLTAPGLVMSASVKTAAYTLTASDFTIIGNCAGAAVPLTLEASPADGQIHNFVKSDSSANALTVAGNGKTISGQSTLTITTQWANYQIQYSAALGAWVIL